MAHVDSICAKLLKLREKQAKAAAAFPQQEQEQLFLTSSKQEVESPPYNSNDETNSTPTISRSPVYQATVSEAAESSIESCVEPASPQPDLSAFSSWALGPLLPQLLPTIESMGLLSQSKGLKILNSSLVSPIMTTDVSMPTVLSPLTAASAAGQLPPVDLKIEQLSSISVLRNVPSGNKDEFRRDFMMHFATKESCKNAVCQMACYTEHYHCIICQKIFTKKDDAMRDMNLHEKQLKSWQFNCARFAPGEVCVGQECEYKMKQTHYHCLESDCPRVFTNTGEIQIHFNSHQKTNALRKEGFQRFRTSETCTQPDCVFQIEKTTHFHCIRDGCTYAFKHKADMEKHKVHHIKNDELAADGFRKFFKYEDCTIPHCKYSRRLNHMHCIREGCNYLLNSVNMILSHKRKHERLENPSELNLTQMEASNSALPSSNEHCMKQKVSFNSEGALDLSLKPINNNCSSLRDNNLPAMEINDKLQTETVPLILATPPITASRREHRPKNYDYAKFLHLFTRRYTANDPCSARCRFLYQNHYHCLAEDGACSEVMRGKQQIREHGREHALIEEVVASGFRICRDFDCCHAIDATESGTVSEQQSSYHYHCVQEDCDYVDMPSRSRLLYRHAKEHAQVKLPLLKRGGDITKSLKRKANSYNNNDLQVNKRRCHAVVSSLPQNGQQVDAINQFVLNFDWSRLSTELFLDSPSQTLLGFHLYKPNRTCPSPLCTLYDATEHFHCIRPQCHCVVETLNEVRHHCVDFHSQVDIPMDIEVYNFNVDCRRPHCLYKQALKHYHCLKESCNESFYREKTMYQHAKKHVESALLTTSSVASLGKATSQITNSKIQVSRNAHTSINSSSITIMKHKYYPIKKVLPRFYGAQRKEGSRDAISCKWSDEVVNSHCPVGSCTLPFCKLKRSDHFHCDECNAGISRADRFLPHLKKHKTDSSKKDT